MTPRWARRKREQEAREERDRLREKVAAKLRARQDRQWKRDHVALLSILPPLTDWQVAVLKAAQKDAVVKRFEVSRD